MRVLVSDKLRVALALKHPREQAKIAIRFGFMPCKFSRHLLGHRSVGPTTKPRFEALGKYLRVKKSDLFRVEE